MFRISSWYWHFFSSHTQSFSCQSSDTLYRCILPQGDHINITTEDEKVVIHWTTKWQREQQEWGELNWRVSPSDWLYTFLIFIIYRAGSQYQTASRLQNRMLTFISPLFYLLWRNGNCANRSDVLQTLTWVGKNSLNTRIKADSWYVNLFDIRW